MSAFSEDDDRLKPEYVCSNCGDPCDMIEESFDYSGTHCNHGQAGTHYTGVYVSECCGADPED